MLGYFVGDVYYGVLVVEGKHGPKGCCCCHVMVLAKSLELLPVKRISSVTGRGENSLVLVLLTFGRRLSATAARGDGERGGGAERNITGSFLQVGPDGVSKAAVQRDLKPLCF